MQAAGVRTIHVPFGISCLYFVRIWEYTEQVAQLQTARYPLASDARGFPCWKLFCLCCQQLKSYCPLPFGITHFLPLITVACPVRNETHFFIPLRVHCQKFNEYALPAEDIPLISFFPSKKNLCASYFQSHGQICVYVFCCFTLNSAF